MLHLQRPLKADMLIEESGWLGRDYNGVPLVASMDLLENARSNMLAKGEALLYEPAYIVIGEAAILGHRDYGATETPGNPAGATAAKSSPS